MKHNVWRAAERGPRGYPGGSAECRVYYLWGPRAEEVGTPTAKPNLGENNPNQNKNARVEFAAQKTLEGRGTRSPTHSPARCRNRSTRRHQSPWRPRGSWPWREGDAAAKAMRLCAVEARRTAVHVRTRRTLNTKKKTPCVHYAYTRRTLNPGTKL